MRSVQLFIYGSLLAPAVLRSVLGHPATLDAARLDGYQRRSLRGRNFPGLVCRRGDTTAGAVLRLTMRDLRRLDRFEDDFYRRRPVQVELEGGGRVVAQAYVLAPRYRFLVARRDWPAPRFLVRDAARTAWTARAP